MASKKKLRREKQPHENRNLGERTQIRSLPLEPRSAKQRCLLTNLQHKQLVFTLGPAGTGKTYVATRHACTQFRTRQIDKIIVTRPMVTAEEDMGFLPGEPHDKFAPYFAPVREILEEDLGRSHVENLLKLRRIEIAPIAFLRGHTFKNAFVIFDEAQNTTEAQMRLFLTRIGEGSQVVVGGDLDQIDIPGPSGLADAIRRFGTLPEVGVTEFDVRDVVRSGLAQKIVRGYK